MIVRSTSKEGADLKQQKGATIAEAAIIFGVVAVVAVLLIVVVIPKINNYSDQQQVSEAVGLATGYTVSLGNLSVTTEPDLAVVGPSLQSLASLVASNSVPTCAWLVEANGTKAGSDCAVSANVYIDPSTSNPFPAQGSSNTNCAGEALSAVGLQKVQRFAMTECAAKAYYGVTRPKDPALAVSAAQYGVQKGASVEAVILTTGGS